MERMDKELAFLLQYENIAWYESGRVRILDRRIYPMKTEYVVCESHREVAQAISDMVTQSGGPILAANMGMALAAYEAGRQKELPFLEYMAEAARVLSSARPTTKLWMEALTNECLKVAKASHESGGNAEEALFLHAIGEANTRYLKKEQAAALLTEKFPKKGAVMTQCFAEVIVGMMAKRCREENREISFICPETRPFLQGARLTASVLSDMGFDTSVICDNMPGYIMKEKNVSLFTSAADVICMDGHVVNKVGTFQIALLAKHFGIPYYATGSPNEKYPTKDCVVIENRPPDQVTTLFDVKFVKDGVSAYYPAFDITPPELVTGIVTHEGILNPFNLYAKK